MQSIVRARPRSTIVPYTTLFRSRQGRRYWAGWPRPGGGGGAAEAAQAAAVPGGAAERRLHAHGVRGRRPGADLQRSEEHTSELQSPCNLACRLLLDKTKKGKSQD